MTEYFMCEFYSDELYKLSTAHFEKMDALRTYIIEESVDEYSARSLYNREVQIYTEAKASLWERFLMFIRKIIDKILAKSEDIEKAPIKDAVVVQSEVDLNETKSLLGKVKDGVFNFVKTIGSAVAYSAALTAVGLGFTKVLMWFNNKQMIKKFNKPYATVDAQAFKELEKKLKDAESEISKMKLNKIFDDDLIARKQKEIEALKETIKNINRASKAKKKTNGTHTYKLSEYKEYVKDIKALVTDIQKALVEAKYGTTESMGREEADKEINAVREMQQALTKIMKVCDETLSLNINDAQKIIDNMNKINDAAKNIAADKKTSANGVLGTNKPNAKFSDEDKKAREKTDKSVNDLSKYTDNIKDLKNE